MNEVLFATGSSNKLREASAILPITTKQLDVDLPEIQSLDLKEIIDAKLHEAYSICKQPVMVEDVSAELEALNGLPGPFIKFFEQRLGRTALYDLLVGYENKRAKITATIGFHDGQDIHYFEGTLLGTVVSGRGENGWGFDHVFMPDGYTRTTGEMTHEEKNQMSHRYLALREFAGFLDEA